MSHEPDYLSYKSNHPGTPLRVEMVPFAPRTPVLGRLGAMGFFLDCCLEHSFLPKDDMMPRKATLE